MDPGTGLTLLGTAIGGAKLVEKLLGPTADYVGSGLKNWAEKRVKNTSRIFEKAAEKLGDRINYPGSVPPKVLKEVLNEGSYCDDELAAEYFGGVLASSRSGITRDDRAASYLKVVSQLSTYQIRFHFISYHIWRSLFVGSGLRPTFDEDLHKMWIFVPFPSLVRSMDFVAGERAWEILIHCMSGLYQQGLLQESYWGSQEQVNAINKKRLWPEVLESGICICPTQFGFDLWLWAIGAGGAGITQFLDGLLQLPKLPSVPALTNVLKLIAAKI